MCDLTEQELAFNNAKVVVTERELKFIKAKSFDKGWRLGMLFGFGITIIVVTILWVTIK